MRIMLYSHGEDFAARSHGGNPQNDVTEAETESNPRGVWAFKRHRGAAAASPHS